MPIGFKLRIKQEFTYKYDGKEMGIDSLININGYYVANHCRVYDRSNDTTYGCRHIMFFEDGMFVQDRFSCIVKKDTPDFFYDILRYDKKSGGFYAYEQCV